MSSENKKLVLDRGDLEDLLSKIAVKAILFLIGLVIAAVVQAARHGLTTHYIVLMAGSVLSGVGMLGYALMELAAATGAGRRWLWAFLALGGFIPYLFGCYLVFYEGFWRLRRVFQGFSPWVILLALCFIVGGYLVVSAIYRISEVGNRIKSGELVVREPEPQSEG